MEDDENKDAIEFPAEITDKKLEYVYIGIILNDPKLMSMYYFLYDDCYFSDKELLDLYKLILFQEADTYAPAVAKEGYNIPREKPNTYSLKQQIKANVAKEEQDVDYVYTELKKLFILKKNYLAAATSSLREGIVEITKYDLYEKMSVEEVEEAIEQISVTNSLSKVVLNKDATTYLLSPENNLSTGVPLPFNILSSVFKGLRKGETMAYAMPSNAGKSRFTINVATYLAFVQKKKVLIISNEMSEEKMRLCLITTVLNNKEMQKLHKQDIIKNEDELLGLQFRPDDPKKVKTDENGYVIREKDESLEDFYDRLYEVSTEFKKTIAVTDWLAEQIDSSIYFIHVTEHSNDDLRKIILNYYYKYNIEYVFYDTMKTDIDNIGNSYEIKKTATTLSVVAQKIGIFIGASLQLLESNTLPVNLTVNDLSVSGTVKEVLDTLFLVKQISNQSLNRYEYSDTETFDKCYDIEPSKDVDDRFYACVVDKNRAGAKPTVLFKLNLAYNSWQEMGYLRLKQTDEN